MITDFDQTELQDKVYTSTSVRRHTRSPSQNIGQYTANTAAFSFVCVPMWDRVTVPDCAWINQV